MICVLDRDTVRKGSRPSVLLRDFELLMHDAPLRIPWSWSLSSLTRVGDLDAPPGGSRCVFLIVVVLCTHSVP